MPRFQVYATHPLQHLAEQGRYFMGLLMQRQRQQKEDEFRERQFDLQERMFEQQAAARATAEARADAEMRRLGIEKTGPRPTKIPSVRVPEAERQPIGLQRQPTTPLTQAPRLSEELAAIRPPVEMGTTRPEYRYSPELETEMARRSPEYVLGREREQELRERRATFAETFRDMPEWIPAGIREGVLGEPILREYLQQMMRPAAGAGVAVTDSERRKSAVEGYQQMFMLLRDRMTSGSAALMGKEVTMQDAVGELYETFGTQIEGLTVEDIQRDAATFMLSGKVPGDPGFGPTAIDRATERAARRPPPDDEPPPATPQEIAELREMARGKDSDEVRRQLEGEYRKEDIDKIVGG
ncbi:MAG: hypothetical protein GTO15_06375 [Pseudomonas stutzeri]|nr:hypothetical protein [Stutzerimonas stutzeri]